MSTTTPRCPRCEVPAVLNLGGQAFCGNEDCAVFCWDPHHPGTFEENTRVIDLSGWQAPPREEQR